MTGDPNPAECLEGEDLGNGWRVLRKITRSPMCTGGHFSVGYEAVRIGDGKRGYLKALDFSSAFEADDFPRKLQELVDTYNFERDLLVKCGKHHMRRVMIPLQDGQHRVAACIGQLTTVHYIIFDMAAGDIRSYAAKMDTFDLAWCLRSMHNATTGMMELHSKGISHQDVKPSNVLVFDTEGSKLTDLGRAFDPEIHAHHDGYTRPGDQTYSPIEQFYQGMTKDLEVRKAGDLYTLGSLLHFHFTGRSVTQAILCWIREERPLLNRGNFQQDLPVIHRAFDNAIEVMKVSTETITPRLAPDIISITKELSNPNPILRGDPITRARMPQSPYNLQRIVTRLDVLARKAEAGLA